MTPSKTFIIAEAGVNHNGNITLAKLLIEAAAKAGADAVKFQTFKAENLASPTANQAHYQIQNTGKVESQFDMLKRLELPYEAHPLLIEHCQNHGIKFLSSAFDLDSIAFLNELGLPLFKIPSGEITTVPYLRAIGRLQKPVILSTGMATIDEIESAINLLSEAGMDHKNLTLLHCTTEYPAPFETVNLKAMVTLGQRFQVPIGYSDHTEGIEVAIAAVALGATVIEKHFTLDKTLPGPDHKASLDPTELAQMVTGIRHIEQALGNGIKQPTPAELRTKGVARKRIVADKIIQKGDLFTPQNLALKRSDRGLNPHDWDRIMNTQAPRDFAINEGIELP